MTTEDGVVDVSQDWLQACSVQERFMREPARNHCRMDYGAHCRQMRALGGDCYDFSCQTDGRLAMLVGDASGKGVAAALMMASVQASLRTAALFTGNNLPALLRVVNAQACASSPADRYATLFYAVLDPTARTLQYVNAGHGFASRWLHRLARAQRGSGGAVFRCSLAGAGHPVAVWRRGACVHGWSDGGAEPVGRGVGD